MKSCAFFDVDHTLINGSTGTETAKEAVKTGIIPPLMLLRIPMLYLKYRTGFFAPSILEKLLCFLEGMHIEELRKLGSKVFEKSLSPRIFTEAVSAVEYERGLGREVVLATSSLACIVEPLADYLGVEKIIATEIETKEGRITGRFEGVPAFGEGKHRKTAVFMKDAGIDPEKCSFYSDSHYDLPLLKRVGEPAAVNPDRRLRREAERRNWRIYNYKATLSRNGGGSG
ncbi:MAG: HAD family hydrolase [Spirochaetaceae bacterium]